MEKQENEMTIESFSWSVADSAPAVGEVKPPPVGDGLLGGLQGAGAAGDEHEIEMDVHAAKAPAPPGGGLPATGEMAVPADESVKKGTIFARKQGTEVSYGEPADSPASGDLAQGQQGGGEPGNFEIQDLMSTYNQSETFGGPDDAGAGDLAGQVPPPQAAGVDYLLEIEGIKGEAIEHTGGVRPAVGDVTGDSSTDAAAGHKDWINIESVSQNIRKQGGGASSAGEGGAGGPADVLQPPPDPQEMGSHAAGGGGGAGKVQMRDFLLTEEDGPSSLAPLEPQQQADSDYLTFKLEDTLISHVSPSVGDADGDAPKIQWNFQDGGVQAEDSWDTPAI